MIKNYDQIVSFDDVKQEAELIKLEADRAGRFITSCLAMKRARQRLAEKERTQQGHRGYHDESIDDIDPYIDDEQRSIKLMRLSLTREMAELVEFVRPLEPTTVSEFQRILAPGVSGYRIREMVRICRKNLSILKPALAHSEI